MSPLFQQKSQEEKHQERLMQLARRAVTEVSFDPGFRYHPWLMPCIESITQRSEAYKANPKWAFDRVTEEVNSLGQLITEHIVDELLRMPDAEQKLERLLNPYEIGHSIVRDVERVFGVKDLGKFMATKFSEIHMKWTDVPLTEDLAGPLDDEWK